MFKRDRRNATVSQAGFGFGIGKGTKGFPQTKEGLKINERFQAFFFALLKFYLCQGPRCTPPPLGGSCLVRGAGEQA